MKKIYIGFSRPSKWQILSWIIQKVQHTEYSHVYLKFTSDSLERQLIYQASGLQVNFVGSEIFNAGHVICNEFELEIDSELHKKILQFAVDKAGSPYSIKQLFNILIYMISGKKLSGDGRSAYVCSELVGEVLKSIKLDINKDLDIITPKDIYQILENKNG